jgi:MFS family permease
MAGQESAGGRATPRALRRLFAPDSILRVPRLGPLVATSLLSSLGSATALLAVAYASFHFSHSLVHTVIVATAYSVPAAVVGQWAGRLADTHDHRHILVITDVAKIVIWTTMAAIAALDRLNPATLTLSSLAAGFAGAIQYPAWQEFERNLVPADRLTEANAVFSSLGAVASVVGAIAGGIVVSWIGPGATFLFNAVTYVPVMIVIARIPALPPSRRSHVERTRLRDTIAYAWRQPPVRVAIELVTVLTLLAVPIASLLPAVAAELSERAHVLGLVTAFYGLGGSLVALVLHQLTKRSKRATARLIVPAVFGCGLSLVVIGILGEGLGGSGRQLAVVAMLVPIGLAIALAQALLSTTLQLSSSAEMEGRMIALYGTAVSLVAPVGALTLAAIAQATTVWVSVTIAGVLLTAFAVVMIATRPAALSTADPDRHRTEALHHGLHLGRFAVGFIHPGQFLPITADTHAGAADDVKPHS